MPTASGRGRPREAVHCGEDAGDDVRVEDRRDGLEPALAAIRAGAHVDVVDPAQQVGPAQADFGPDPVFSRARPLCSSVQSDHRKPSLFGLAPVTRFIEETGIYRQGLATTVPQKRASP